MKPYKHTLDRVKMASLKYKTRKEFERGDRNVYAAVVRNGWLGVVCSHMPKNANAGSTPHNFNSSTKKSPILFLIGWGMNWWFSKLP